MDFYVTLKKTTVVKYVTKVIATTGKEAEQEALQYASSTPQEFDLFDSVDSSILIEDPDDTYWEVDEIQPDYEP